MSWKERDVHAEGFGERKGRRNDVVVISKKMLFMLMVSSA